MPAAMSEVLCGKWGEMSFPLAISQWRDNPERQDKEAKVWSRLIT